jgi:RNA polymerase sigma-70 factor (TIGR02952 family)
MTRPLPGVPSALPPAGQGADPAPRPVPRPRPSPRPSPVPRQPVQSTSPEEATVLEPQVVVQHETTPATSEPAPVEERTDDQLEIWELVRRAQGGDAESFGQLYDRYVDAVFRYLYHRVGDRATAEDFTSETFVRALRRIDSLSFQGRDVGAWLVTIARNIIRDHVKSSRYRLEVTTADMRDADRGTDGPEDAVVQQLTNEQLLACVKQLGSEQQECIVLRFLHGLSVSETAQIMGKKDGAIKALQHRAVRRLAGMLPEGLR